MTQDEFSDDLIRHCEQKALEAVASDTEGLVRAVLSASGYAEREAECVDLHKTATDWSDRALIAETQNAELVAALEGMLHAVCGETGFANAVRTVTGTAYPWPALDIAEEHARAAIAAAGQPQGSEV